MDLLVRAVPVEAIAAVLAVDRVRHQIVRPAGTDFQTIQKRENP